jgi:hypothetical protein
MAADATHPHRAYQSREQVVIAWIAVVLTVGGGVVVLLLPAAHRHGKYVIAGVAFLVALSVARVARSGVYVSAGGVRVRNVLSTTDLAWEQIREFKLSPVGACLIGLKDGTWVSIIGIEQTNWAWLKISGPLATHAMSRAYHRAPRRRVDRPPVRRRSREPRCEDPTQSFQFRGVPAHVPP